MNNSSSFNGLICLSDNELAPYAVLDKVGHLGQPLICESLASKSVSRWPLNRAFVRIETDLAVCSRFVR